MPSPIDNTDDVIDIRDVIDQFEAMEDELYTNHYRHCGEEWTDTADCMCNDHCPVCNGEIEPYQSDENEEAFALQILLEECKGNGGDHQWRGDWYPVTLIRDSYFKEYAQELAEDIGALPKDAGWPAHCIDWDQAARELQTDYTSIDFGGVTYWVR